MANKQYWLHIGDGQYGPLTAGEVRARAAEPERTYIWTAGMATWQRLDRAAGFWPPEDEDETDNGNTASETVAAETGQSADTAAEAAAAEAAATPRPPKPATNFFWAIFCTLLCCQPLGLAALILSAMTHTEYRLGHYDKAERYSRHCEMLIMVSIALGLVCVPVSLIITLLA